MKLTRVILLGLTLQTITGITLAQQNLVYNHYFLNPFLYNPSFVAPNGYMELDLNYRKQWAGFTGAPTTGTINFHLPINYKMGIALTGIQDEAGVLRTTTGLLSFGYAIYIGHSVQSAHKIGFGLSAGYTSSSVKLDEASNPGDPALLNNTTSSIDGQFGLHYQFKGLRLGFAIPKLFKSYVVSSEGFNTPEIQQIQSTLSSIGYVFNFTPRVSFEPIVLFRTEEGVDSQLEGTGVLRIDNLLWVGGSYRQDYGAAAFFGFNLKERVKVGYAYEFATDQVSGFGNGSHEIQLAIRLGKKKEAPIAKQEEPDTTSTIVAVKEETKPTTITPEETEKPEEVKNETQPETNITTEQNNNQVTPPIKEEEQPRKEPTQDVVQETVPLEEQKPTKLNGENLAAGNYVVVGAFRSLQNAKNYNTTLKKAGYPSDVAYHPQKGYYIVHMKNAATLDEAKKLRDDYRAKSRYSFRDTWVLTIE